MYSYLSLNIIFNAFPCYLHIDAFSFLFSIASIGLSFVLKLVQQNRKSKRPEILIAKNMAKFHSLLEHKRYQNSEN